MAEARGPEPPVVNLVGERIALGPPRHGLLPADDRWINALTTVDRSASRTLGGLDVG